MKFKIHYEGAYTDEIIVSGESIDEIRDKVFAECERRGWEKEKCWSEET
jgi:hypothetical protein